jgi:hypothetical protein
VAGTLEVDVGDDDSSAELCKAAGDGSSTSAAAGAGDDGDFGGEVQGNSMRVQGTRADQEVAACGQGAPRTLEGLNAAQLLVSE